MDRNNKFLKFLFVSVAFFTLTNCFDNKKTKDESIYDSETKYLSLSNAVGKYYFIPNKNDYVNEYKIFNLKKGDTVFLEIKQDSTFVFNYFYYNKERGNKEIGFVERYSSIVEKNLDDKSKISIPFPDDLVNVQGFLISKKDTIFYYRLSIEKYNNYAYRMIFKKMK